MLLRLNIHCTCSASVIYRSEGHLALLGTWVWLERLTIPADTGLQSKHHICCAVVFTTPSYGQFPNLCLLCAAVGQMIYVSLVVELRASGTLRCETQKERWRDTGGREREKERERPQRHRKDTLKR